MSVTVRPPRRDEIGALWALVREFADYNREPNLVTGSPETLSEKIFSDTWPVFECLVAESNGRLVGFAAMLGAYAIFRTQPTMWLEDLFVTESARGTGAGKALIAAVAEAAVRRGCLRMGWSVSDWNAPSIAFYEHLGAVRHTGEHIYLLGGEKLTALAALAAASR